MKKTLLLRFVRPVGCVSAAALMMLIATHTPVLAAADVEGCNPAVAAAQEKVAEVKVAKYVADVEEIVTQPESTTALTCFNQSAATAAAEGGAIFSGDFTESLAPVITTALNSFYDDFAGAAGFQSFLGDIGLDSSAISSYLSGAIGNGLNNALSNSPVAGGVVNSALNFIGSGNTSVGGILSAVTNGIAYNTQVQGQSSNNANVQCNGVKGLWDKIQSKGITKSIPQLSLKDLLDGPGSSALSGLAANSKFLKNWQANDTSGVFSAAATAIGAIPGPAPTGNFNGATSSCQVLVIAGVLPAGTTCPN